MKNIIQLPKGYKKTDAGIIPEDWESVELGQHIQFIGGHQPAKHYFSTERRKGYIRLIQIRDYKTDDFIVYVPSELARKKCTASDIMIGRYGPPIFQILRGLQGAYNVALMKAIPDNNLDQQYMYYLLQDTKIFTFVEKLSQRSSGQTGVDLAALREFIIPFPNELEQKNIASALADVDHLIELLEKLIKKKKQIKLGAMQELLTGKRRLPGFNEKWKRVCLGDCCEIISGGTPSTNNSSYWNGSIPWCTPSDITKANSKYLYATEKYITTDGFSNSGAVLLPVGTILLCSRATIGIACLAGVPMTTNQGFKSLICKTINNNFLYYLLPYLKSQILEKAIGSTFLEISKKALAEITFLCPSLLEQGVIADLLSDMDSEIDALNFKLSKYRDIKQGMMQQLLTGKIRLLSEKTIAEPVLQPKIIPFPQLQKNKGHDEQFDDAVVISVIINRFGDDKFKLDRFRYNKLMYLMRRYCEQQTKGFEQHAAGPYKSEARYRGGEGIATRNKYIKKVKHKGYDCFDIGEKISAAEEYFSKWYDKSIMNWLLLKFHYSKNWELELWATVDMAIVELRKKELLISWQSVKQYIANTPKWKKKLEKWYFSDTHIELAITKSEELFGT